MTDKRKRPRVWTATEDTLLREAIARYDSTTIDWQGVASHFEGRTNKDCRKRWVYALKTVVNKGRWGHDEDLRLEEGFKQHGGKWNKVAEVVGTRQADQCSRRWHECLNPTINRSRWSLLEDSTLECAVRVYGRNWTEIVDRFFYDRTPIAARNRYKQRFEKGTGAHTTSNSMNQGQQISAGWEEENSESSSSPLFAYTGPENSNRLLHLPIIQPPGACDAPESGHVAARYIVPISLSADSNHSTLIDSMEASPTASSSNQFAEYSPTNLPSDSTYQASSRSTPGTQVDHDGTGFTPARSLSNVSLLDIEQAFYDLYPSSSGGLGHIVSTPQNRNNNHTNTLCEVSNPAAATDMVHPPSFTIQVQDSMPSWGQLAPSVSLDQMIRQLASYRVHSAGVYGGESSIVQHHLSGLATNHDIGHL